MQKSRETLEREILFHNYRYFILNDPVISDFEYDKLVLELKKIAPDSPVLQEIGAGIMEKIDPERAIPHITPMLSLDKCYNDTELINWASNFKSDVIISPKIDGLAAALRYDKNGILTLALTRGDGQKGENITGNIYTIQDIPTRINFNDIEVRGEIYMKLSVFDKYKNTFANPRNLASGAIKQKDSQKAKEYNLSFIAYDIIGGKFKTEEEKISVLKNFGFDVVLAKFIKRENFSNCFLEFLEKNKKEFDYEIDGVVFKANEILEQERLGSTIHHPRYAIAYKLQGEEGTSFVKDVVWSVARTGVITPVCIIEPIKLSGAYIERASLHNYGFVKKMEIRINSKVSVMRRGGVIPNIERVIEKGYGKEVLIPSGCPGCGSATRIEDDFLYCTKRNQCRSASIAYLEHFIKVIECDGFGDKLIEKLYDENLVKEAHQFFELKKEDLMKLERMGEKLANKLLKNLSEKKKLSLDVFLRSLGIDELGTHVAQILANFKALDKILILSEEDLLKIHTIGEVTAKSVVHGLKENKKNIDELLKYITIVSEETGEDKPLFGKSFVFTGALSGLSRDEASRIIKKMGGTVKETVIQDLTYLVVSDENIEVGEKSNKLTKAEKYIKDGAKIKIIKEKDFIKLLDIKFNV
jgi:DNA ligase (NAD+)